MHCLINEPFTVGKFHWPAPAFVTLPEHGTIAPIRFVFPAVKLIVLVCPIDNSMLPAKMFVVPVSAPGAKKNPVPGGSVGRFVGVPPSDIYQLFVDVPTVESYQK